MWSVCYLYVRTEQMFHIQINHNCTNKLEPSALSSILNVAVELKLLLCVVLVAGCSHTNSKSLSYCFRAVHTQPVYHPSA